MIAYKTRPSDPSQWHSLVAKASRFNPADVDQSGLIGGIIYEGFFKNPIECIEMVISQARDNSDLMKKVIGESNFKIINV